MSFELILPAGNHRQVYDFLNKNGIRTVPFTELRTLNLDEGQVWELSQQLPRLFVAQRMPKGMAFGILGLDPNMGEVEALTALRIHETWPIVGTSIDMGSSGHRVHPAMPALKPLRLKDLVWWPLDFRERTAMKRFLESSLDRV